MILLRTRCTRKFETKSQAHALLFPGGEKAGAAAVPSSIAVSLHNAVHAHCRPGPCLPCIAVSNRLYLLQLAGLWKHQALVLVAHKDGAVSNRLYCYSSPHQELVLVAHNGTEQ